MVTKTQPPSYTLQQVCTDKTGLLVVDKPSGVSSHAVVNWARKVVGIKKIGHTGTLDPLATGLLLLLVGRSWTKRQYKFLKKDKIYTCRAIFGQTTDTYDVMGQVMSTADWNRVSSLTKQQIIDALTAFTGEIIQTVPPFSAVKIKGQKLYDLARQGEIDSASRLPNRTVSVESFKLLSLLRDDKQQLLTANFQIHCSSGTYIRSLIHDVGQVLGVGATVTHLRRIAIGSYSIEDATICPLFKKRHLPD